jgi:SAM-dependent methyltransferase
MREIASRDSDVRILDIACGPCREYRDWPERGNGSKVEIVAMDNDPIALEYVSDNVANRLTEATSLRAVRYNALRTKSASATIRNFGKFDVIYSVGLCDYLSDAHLIGMLGAWRETLQDGGVLYVAFKDTERYDKTPYQWHLDWFFVQRTQTDVLNLFRAAGFNVDVMETTPDRTGIIINFIHRTPTQPLQRMDIAERVSHRHAGSVASIPTARAQFE